MIRNETLEGHSNRPSEDDGRRDDDDVAVTPVDRERRLRPLSYLHGRNFRPLESHINSRTSVNSNGNIPRKSSKLRYQHIRFELTLGPSTWSPGQT